MVFQLRLCASKFQPNRLDSVDYFFRDRKEDVSDRLNPVLTQNKMNYKATMEMKEEKLEIIDKLMKMELGEDPVQEELIGATRNSSRKLFNIPFIDGKSIVVSLCSTETHYYIDLSLVDDKGQELESETQYGLEEQISMKWHGNTYDCSIRPVA